MVLEPTQFLELKIIELFRFELRTDDRCVQGILGADDCGTDEFKIEK